METLAAWLLNLEGDVGTRTSRYLDEEKYATKKGENRMKMMMFCGKWFYTINNSSLWGRHEQNG